MILETDLDNGINGEYPAEEGLNQDCQDMKTIFAKTLEQQPFSVTGKRSIEAQRSQIGQTTLVLNILEINAQGYPIVGCQQQEYNGIADMLIPISQQHIGQRCLCVFPNNQERPIITGVLHTPDKSLKDQGAHQKIQAKKSLTLSCGKSSLTLEADGHVILQGDTIISKAKASQRIKGAVVKIN